MNSPVQVWTVGHSNHDQEHFLGLLAQHGIEYLVDVRSHPYSRFADHFDREEIERALQGVGVRYVFMGEELGGRPSDEDHLDAEGHALYGPMAETPTFLRGIERVLEGAQKGRLAIMCSCGKPDDCHRRLLVGKVLSEQGAELVHILPEGELRYEAEVEIGGPPSLFGETEDSWRSTRSVLRRPPPSTSSAA